jgi:hypothetical protein
VRLQRQRGGTICRIRQRRDDEQRGNDTWVIEVPVSLWDFGFPVGAFRLPTGAGDFIHVSIVAKFHDVVDSGSAVTVVIIIGLPDGTEGVDSSFVVVTEVMAEYFHIA